MAADPVGPGGSDEGAGTAARPDVERLERELRATRAQLERTIEDLGAANEQLRATNEELQAANEELRTSREALRASEERLRLFVEHAPAAVAMLDREMHYLAASRRWLADYRLSFSDVQGRSHYDVFPEVPERWKEIHRRCLAGAVERCEEDPFPRADGTVDWVRWEVHPWRTAAGEVGGLMILTEVITDRKLARDALRASEERLRKAQEIAHLGSWELDLATNALSWSDEVYRIFGLAPQEFGASYEAFLEGVHPDDRVAVDAAYASSLREGRDAYDFVHRVVRRSTGEIRIVHEKCEHLRDASGRIVKSVGMVHDITEARAVEEALRDANEQLLAADRAKNAFLAVLSHELRNPLAPIANSLYVLDRAPPGSDRAIRARQILGRQVAQLANLVNDLLDVTRITRNKIELQREPLDLDACVRRAVEDGRSFFEPAGVRLEFVPSPRPVPVHADRTRVAQIVGNLLQNAAKFTARGGLARVWVEAEGGEASLHVADDGVGMTRETLDRLFQPFMQADRTLDRSRGGLGLGLALVKGLVELHGGSVSATSEGPGRGTEFVVHFPLVAAATSGPP